MDIEKIVNFLHVYDDMENRLHELTRKELMKLVDTSGLSEEEKKDCLRQLYWHIQEPNEFFLEQSFGYHPDQFEEIVQNFFFEFHCYTCPRPILVYCRDRQDRDRYWSIGLVCEECTRVRGEASLLAYQNAEQEKAQQEQTRKVAELRAMPYQEYLMTEHWQTVRAATLKRDDNRCRLCRSTERLQVHHNTYERRGCEDPDDTITLCGDCHQMFHDHRQLARPQ
jgi:hypothetical protein